MNSAEMNLELATLSGIPVYKVAQMMTHLVRVIRTETKRGGTVALPNLGAFRGKRHAPKTQKNVILMKGPGGLVKGSKNLPARRSLGFIPIKSAKWL